MEPNIASTVTHPYLKVIFNFLCDDSKEFKSGIVYRFECNGIILFLVLENADISLGDKVGFACRFLDDATVSNINTI